jgi:alanyl-tRNA synthetase
MTERLYYHDAYLREFDARVLACTPAVEHFEVQLDRTAFYATSGGQPNDTGRLGDASVLDVREGDNGAVLHVTDRELPSAGAQNIVHGVIDWPRRFDHMQQHTGQHLLSAVFLEHLRMRTVSFHLGREISTIDLDAKSLDLRQVEDAERRVNALIFDDRLVTVRFGTREELAAGGVRKEVEREGILRAIEIEGVECQPCGGTHVARTGQIGLLLLRKFEKQRGNWRIEFLCGGRALAVARKDYATLGEASRVLGCAPGELPAQMRRGLDEKRDIERNHQRILERLAHYEAAELLEAAGRAAEGSRARIVVRVLDDAGASYLRLLGTAIAASSPATALLATRAGGHIVFAQSAGLPGDMNALLRATLAEFGGKGGGTRDFAQGAISDLPALDRLLALAASRLQV